MVKGTNPEFAGTVQELGASPKENRKIGRVALVQHFDEGQGAASSGRNQDGHWKEIPSGSVEVQVEGGGLVVPPRKFWR